MTMLQKFFIICCEPFNETTAVCFLDEGEGCIRKYASKCHLNVAACQKRKNYTNYDNLYCSMEAYFCETSPTYARWTIFFGQKMN
ncbi:uncharacterized protein [Drosophila tropicalis]|uniref:uncharacterized protein n=1 Tax=Drosophila tropicalis TaxID=46794 RepID=UPI0035AB9843